MTSKIKPENIPDELAKRDQWVNWCEEIRDGKPTKIPLNPASLKNAKSNDPKTWGTFKQALKNINGDIGIGFVVTDNDPFAGLDLDQCKDLETGDFKPWANKIVQEVSS